MNIKGLDALAKHFPESNSTGGRLKLAGIVFGSFALTTAYFLISDQIPTWTIDSQIVVFALGFLFVSRAFTQKKLFIEKYKENAYQQAALRFIFPGVSILFAAVAHIAYMNGPKFAPSIITTFAHILGWYWLIVGAILWIRSALAFGLDNLAFLYLYHPEQGKIVNTNIYNIMRHSIYAGAMRIGLGLALLNTGIFALSFIPFLLLGFFGWVRLVEEKDLIERFPDYLEYRKKIPAFWVKPRDIISFWKFILVGDV
jgi:protein-S-isoprenylcysteine O-methyltransferase Ste14